MKRTIGDNFTFAKPFPGVKSVDVVDEMRHGHQLEVEVQANGNFINGALLDLKNTRLIKTHFQLEASRTKSYISSEIV